MSIVALLETLVEEIKSAEEKFFHNPKSFYELETSVKASAESFTAGFLGAVLSDMDNRLCNDGLRKNDYTIARRDQRTIISSVGDIVFNCTYFKSRGKDGGYHYLLEEMIGLDAHERFSEAAETAILIEAMKTSYEEASKVIPSRSMITKTTVMNKVHGIADAIPCDIPAEKKECEYLFIEADEDHVAEQHGRWCEENEGFISRLAYVYEYKREVPKVKGRKELVNTFYFGGLYEGSKGVKRFWESVDEYIRAHYDIYKLKRVFISGDGAGWIKSGTSYIGNSLYCVDKYHMSKYINAAANQMGEEADSTKADLYRYIYKKKRRKFKELTDKMAESAGNIKKIEDLQVYALGNWDAVMRTYHNKLLSGCSAEGHVSNVLSDRLSSRPMGWSQTGADRMSKLRCYERNYGRENIINLVRYSREQRRLKNTGTEDVRVERFSMKDVMYDHYDQGRSYIERMQAKICGQTVAKQAAIRTHLWGM